MKYFVLAFALFLHYAYAQALDTVRIGGSTTVESTVLRGESLKNIRDELLKNNIKIRLSTTSSGDGVRRLDGHFLDLSMNSGGLGTMRKIAEVDCAKYNLHLISQGKIVFYVHQENPVNKLTATQIREIYAKGNKTSWSQYGGYDHRIVAVAESPSGGMRSHMKLQVNNSHEMNVYSNSLKVVHGNISAIAYTYTTDADPNPTRLQNVKIIEVEDPDHTLRQKVQLSIISPNKISREQDLVIKTIYKHINKKSAAPKEERSFFENLYHKIFVGSA